MEIEGCSLAGNSLVQVRWVSSVFVIFSTLQTTHCGRLNCSARRCMSHTRSVGLGRMHCDNNLPFLDVRWAASLSRSSWRHMEEPQYKCTAQQHCASRDNRIVACVADAYMHALRVWVWVEIIGPRRCGAGETEASF
jgi:hypothetical protein|eukprot:SAG25_NODE_393_length_8567_cov_15.363368_16_plen_137_part_00